MKDTGEKVVLWNDKVYSRTTARHQSLVKKALREKQKKNKNFMIISIKDAYLTIETANKSIIDRTLEIEKLHKKSSSIRRRSAVDNIGFLIDKIKILGTLRYNIHRLKKWRNHFLGRNKSLRTIKKEMM